MVVVSLLKATLHNDLMLSSKSLELFDELG